MALRCGHRSGERVASGSENDTYILRRTQIADIQFELQEYKRVFFYRPVMRFPNGQEISTTGYFDATGMIRVDSTREVSAGVKEVADIRCCRSCSFSDWGL